MPIFHDPDESILRPSFSRQASSTGLPRPGTLDFATNTSFSHGMQSKRQTDDDASLAKSPESPNSFHRASMLGRNEWMDKIKRTSSPLWLQRQGNNSLSDQSFEHRPVSRDRPRTPLSSSSELQASRTSTPEPLRDLAAAGLEIQRPRSALHSGDFREQKDGLSGRETSSSAFLATSPVVPWNRSFPVAAYPPYITDDSHPDTSSNDTRTVARARAISQSSYNSFAFLPPTSPLVHQANNTDLDFSSRPGSRQGSSSPDRTNRRHTFSPAAIQGYHSDRMARVATGTPATRHSRYGTSMPYQAHQPRRSMTFNQFQPQSHAQTPNLAARRPSFSSEASPLQHAPMVGSYEESILRGRMSTTPSRPLNFVAKIGVLGKGQCKPSLKCPPHVTVPFPAVFYSYNTGNGRISDNEPSPYVGLIDLENSLPPPEDSGDSGKRKRRHMVPAPDQDDLDFRIHLGEEEGGQKTGIDLRRREKKKRRSTSPKAPPGGCYRIPPQGQLQIVLKNPNKTAVKLFLVPYDFLDMEPGQKTFIRQRSYSAGPIIDMPTSSRKNLGTDRPEAALSHSDDPNDRPILRYLVHLHICCPSKGRHYLYRSIRVVFANRVPDGKEKLRNEIQLPEPKYSTYKPSRDSATPQSTCPVGTQAATDESFRRRSAGLPLSQPHRTFNQLDEPRQQTALPPPAVKFTGGTASSSVSSGFSTPLPDLQSIPFSLTRLAAIESRPVSRDHMDIDPKSPFKTPLASPKPGLGSPNSHVNSTFEKLNKGDVGYGGNAFSPIGSPIGPPNAGLLSQRLRSLEVQRDDED